MIRDLNNLYAAICDNTIVAFDTNLKDFLEKFEKIEGVGRNYAHYYREFKKTDKIKVIGKSGKEYLLQKAL